MAFTEWYIIPMAPVIPSYWFSSLMQELIGSFIFVMFYKIMGDDRLFFSKEPAINCFILACSYIASRSIVNGGNIASFGACLNPAFAIGISLVSAIEDPGTTFKWFWIYWFMPILGSLLAIVFYRFVYLKTQLMLNHELGENETNLEEIKATVYQVNEESVE